MKFSIITWDASFRESFHTVDAFGRQNYDKNKFELYWCDFYNNNNQSLIQKIKSYSNFKLLNLKNNESTQWHLGKIINYGIKHSTGDILVIPDGDVVVPENFLTEIENLFDTSNKNLLCYFRRWDEPSGYHGENSYNIDYLQNACKLNNMTNYGGCFAIRREVFEEIGFYEEHEVFSGPGANGLEQYKRFRNKGLQIMWSEIPIYHPFHNFTGTSDKINSNLKLAAITNPWIVPYMGLNQSWVLKQLDKNIDWEANNGKIDSYLKELKPIEAYIRTEDKSNILTRSSQFIKRKFKKI
jgi:hypothetical protein